MQIWTLISGNGEVDRCVSTNEPVSFETLSPIGSEDVTEEDTGAMESTGLLRLCIDLWSMPEDRKNKYCVKAKGIYVCIGVYMYASIFVCVYMHVCISVCLSICLCVC